VQGVDDDVVPIAAAIDEDEDRVWIKREDIIEACESMTSDAVNQLKAEGNMRGLEDLQLRWQEIREITFKEVRYNFARSGY
jgi:hypothetical protein